MASLGIKHSNQDPLWGCDLLVEGLGGPNFPFHCFLRSPSSYPWPFPGLRELSPPTPKHLQKKTSWFTTCGLEKVGPLQVMDDQVSVQVPQLFGFSQEVFLWSPRCFLVRKSDSSSFNGTSIGNSTSSSSNVTNKVFFKLSAEATRETSGGVSFSKSSMPRYVSLGQGWKNWWQWGDKGDDFVILQ